MKVVNFKAMMKLVDKLNEINTELETLRDKEIDRYDNLSEAYMESERGEIILECNDTLCEACDQLTEVISLLEGMEEE